MPRLTALAVVVVALTALAVPAAAGTAVPFKGRVQGAETSTLIDPTHLSVTRENTGNATHLGHFTAVEHFVVDLTTFPTATGTEVFTAANGDLMFATTFGVATPIPGTTNLSLEEMVTITGGTGRFAGATGTVTGDRVLAATGLSAGSFDGTISSPGASTHWHNAIFPTAST